MKTTDKFLIAIVAGIVLLVGVTLVVALIRSKPNYQPDNTPEGVVHNYLTALREDDYTRAYNYILPTIWGYSDFVETAEQAKQGGWNSDLHDGAVTLEIESTRHRTENLSVVTVRRRYFYERGLFGSREYSNTYNFTLTRREDGWKICQADWYWERTWNFDNACELAQ